MTAIFPGSFDPITNGHIDIIRRALRFCDRVIVAVVCRNVFKEGLFTPDERVKLVKDALIQTTSSDKIENDKIEVNRIEVNRIEVRVFYGLLADFFDECGADVIVRGARSALEYDRDMAQTLANRQLNPRLETIFLPADPAQVFLSSSIVKEIATFGGDIHEMVPACVAEAMRQAIGKK